MRVGPGLSRNEPGEWSALASPAGREAGPPIDSPDSAHEPTPLAPPYRAPLDSDVTGPLGLGSGTGATPVRVGDFDLLALLGRGAFASVYLGRQISLDRPVALKVSACLGHEARTLATLEHDHIVQVFSESVEGGLRLLCMQYVPGATLGRIVSDLRRREGAWSGRTLLDVIDARTPPQPAAFDPAALRDWEFLAGADRVQAVCRIGARLAEALAYAHARGVLHRDLKPDNILINQYGRPFLTDFHLAFDLHRPADPDWELFGGTLPYLAPEHLDALCGAGPRETVDERSDQYALGVVLFELLNGVRPFPEPPEGLDWAARLRTLAADRRNSVPKWELSDVPQPLARVLLRCLEADPERRFASAKELAKALEGCGELRRVERELPAGGRLTRAASARPFLWLTLLAVLPNLAGSVVNVAYNMLQIFPDPGPERAAFFRLVWVYNAVVYPSLLAMAYALVRPVYGVWAALSAGRPVAAESVALARRRVVAWPLWGVMLSALGWLPGGIVFPWVLRTAGQPVDVDAVNHLLMSFWISGLIALTYAFFGIAFVSVRVFYPRLWSDARDPRSTARAELGGLESRLRIFQLLAGLIPLTIAALLVGLGPDAMPHTFRLLAVALIVAGMAGIGPTVIVSGILGQTLHVLRGTEGRTREG